MFNQTTAVRLFFITFFFSCLFIGNDLSAQQVSIQSSDAKTGDDAPTVHNLTNVPAGALLVITTTCQYGYQQNAVVSSNPALTWNKHVDADDGATGGAEIHTAVFPAGGSIQITSNWGTTDRYQSSVCYVVINQEATWGGAFAIGLGQPYPSVDITTTRINSIIFCATSDWNLGAGQITYRGSATQTHTASNPGDAAFYHYYYSAATASAYTVGMTSPFMDGGGSTAVLEIRSQEGDATPPSAPTLNSNPTIGSTSIGLSWTASTDNVGVTGYEVYVGGVLNGTTTNTTYTVTGLTPSTQYSIYVRAKDAAGNGTNSNAITPTTAAPSGAAWELGGNTNINPTTNFIGTTDDKSLSFRTNNTQRIFISGVTGNVGIGTTAITGSTYKLYVKDGIRTEKVKVDISGNWADYVFYKEYKLPSLKEVEEFIKKNQHLPGVPSAAEVEKEGLDLGDNQATLLKKIEELTLYIIEMNKKIEKLTEENELLKRKPEVKNN